jgi:tetratricopeptide (TPR) repeat protein
MQNKDFATAKTELEKALAVNPNDCEALMLLGDVGMELGDGTTMLTSYEKALACPGITDKQRAEISIKMYNAWVSEYNNGINAYNAYSEGRADSDLLSSIKHLENAVKLKPTFTEPMALLGGALESKVDTAAAYKTYLQWWNVEKPGFDIMRDKGIILGTSRSQVHAVLGQPSETRTDSLQGGGVVFKDKIDVGGRVMYVFSSDETGGTPALEGWTYNPPASLADGEVWRGRVTSLAPIKALAYIDYQNGRKEHSLEMCNVVGAVKPVDQELVPLRTQLLQDLGKADEALREMEAQLKRDPSQINYRLQYATLLTGAGRANDAIDQYKMVLKQDRNNETALYNLAAAYKNKAGSKQRTELEKMDKDKKYQPDMSYLDDLKTAAEYFELLRATPKYSTDIIVLEQLANVYEVTKDKSKVKALIMELEGLEQLHTTDKTYYQIMEGLYGRNNMIEKMKGAAAKGAKL